MAAQREPGKTHYLSIFLSDIHLGTRGCKADILADFLKAHTCDRLYLVGDIIDGWRLKSGFYWPQSHTNVMRRFLTMSKRGTEIIFITGNHDEFLRRYSNLELGNIRLLDEATHVTPDGRRLLVVHGDLYDVVTRYHRWLALLGDKGYGLLLRINAVFNRWRLRYGYGYWSLSAWIKGKVKRAVNFISEYEEAVARHCRQQNYDGVICGHIHHAGISRLDGIEYMNCGDWVESCTALVEDGLGRFRILRWADHYEPAAMTDGLPPEVIIELLDAEPEAVVMPLTEQVTGDSADRGKRSA